MTQFKTASELVRDDSVSKANKVMVEVDNLLRTDEAKQVAASDPINWADLHCFDVRVGWDVEGNETIDIWIEEADPNCTELPNFLYEKLVEEQGREALIDIHTEW